MKAKALEIRWHDTKPIFSADFQPTQPTQYHKIAHPYAKAAASTSASAPGEKKVDAPVGGAPDEHEKMWRLATAGGDNLVRLWLVHPRPPPPPAPLVLVANPTTSKLPPVAPAAPLFDGSPRVEYLATLHQHTGVVNVVRFSPVGETLASAGDDGNILFWIPGENTSTFGESAEDKAYERESWRVRSMLRTKSGQEIYDLAWSPDGTCILAGSVDHTANIYNVATSSLTFLLSSLSKINRFLSLVPPGQLVCTIADHTNYVQGVAWDPHNHFISTQSSDRSVHIYSLSHESTGALLVHPVSKNSRMDIQHKVGGTWSSSSSSSLASTSTSVSNSTAATEATSKSKGKSSATGPAAPLPGLRHSDSDSSSTASTPLPGTPTGNPAVLQKSAIVAVEEEHSMDPPAPRPSSSRRSSNASMTGPSGGGMSHLRSPSPAPPLPAVMVPLSPKELSTPLNGGGNSSSLSNGGVASGSASGSGSGSASTASAAAKFDSQRLYGDANSTPFFRRLCWSTDGSLLLTPAGLFEDPYAVVNTVSSTPPGGVDGEGAPKKRGRKSGFPVSALAGAAKPTVYIYSRGNVGRAPIAHLPGHKTTSIAIKFCPQLWELRKLEIGATEEEECVTMGLGPDGIEKVLPGRERELKQKEKEVRIEREAIKVDEEMEEGAVAGEKEKDGEGKIKSLFDLKYRMVYAVATLDCVYIYDTQQSAPICMFGNLHYAPFTDLSWTSDGQTLVVSSQDGYCSIIAFDPLELGTPYRSPIPLPLLSHRTTPTASSPNLAPPQPVSLTQPVAAPSGEKRKDTDGANASGNGEVNALKKKPKRATLNFLAPLGGGAPVLPKP